MPSGKWTRRESKQNWVRFITYLLPRSAYLPFNKRHTYIKEIAARDRELSNTFYVPPSRTSRPNSPYSSGSGYNSPGTNSGYVTPREAREEAWRLEAEEKARPGKVEMREMYKELNGRKARTKGKFGSAAAGLRDKGGWGGGGGGGDDDY